jgi:hypothetical protein
MSAVIPESFGEWRHCIEHDCGIQLSREFIEKRIALLRASGHEETKRFIRHYGETHRHSVVEWFERMHASL